MTLSDESRDEGATVAALIRENKAIAVSDGSYGEGFSTSAFIVTARKRKLAKTILPVRGTNVVPGDPKDQD